MGNPYPNLTNSFVSFFINSFRDLKDKTLLEIGSGESTVYWSNYFGQVCSYEDDPQWASTINVSDNVDLVLNNPSTIFEDDFFKRRIETSDFIIIDNNPKVLPRERFCEFVEKHQSDNSQVILDNCTWNLDAYNFMLGRYFCMDFPGQNKSGETTVTSLFFAKKTSKYFSPEQIEAWEKSS